MVKRHVPLEAGETVCPACGAGIRATPTSRRRRLQCPKCREVVTIGNVQEEDPQPALPSLGERDTATDTRNRIDLLEARVEALEATLRDAMAATRSSASHTPQRKLVWVTTTPGQAPEFTAEQGQALFHNLGGVRSQAITIRAPAGDVAARIHAEWFKSIFERAGWTVHGPEELAQNSAVSGLSLAVPELPVAKDAAATYLALKAAGFEPIPVLDSAPPGEPGKETAALALTLPPVKAA